MTQALELQWSQSHTYDNLSFEERVGLMVNQELTARSNKRLLRLLKAPDLKSMRQKTKPDAYRANGLR